MVRGPLYSSLLGPSKPSFSLQGLFYLSALFPSPLQKNQNLKPLKGPLNPQPPILTWQMSLLPTTLERKLLELRPHPLALPPPKQKAMTPEPPKRFPAPSISQDLKQTHFLSERQWDWRALHGFHVPFSISDIRQTEEKLGSFSKNHTRYRNNSSTLHKHII